MSDEDAVRALLAEARHDEPVPAEVVARLERTLAEIRTETAPVAHLVPTRRRRLWGAGLLAAAAAVTAIAVIGPRIGVRPSDDSAGSAAGGSAGSATDGTVSGEAAGESAPSAADVDDEAAGGEQDRLRVQYLAGDVTPLSEADFDPEVAALHDSLPASSSPGTSSFADAGLECAPADWGAGEVLAVTYGGTPAVLVFRPDGVTADLLACGTADVIRSTTLPGE